MRWYISELPCANLLNGCGMGPLLVLVSPWENVVVTCKIVSFLYSIDNLLQKNIIIFFFENPISKWRSFEKKGWFWPTFTFLVTREKLQKNSFSIYLTHIHICIFLTLLSFLPYQFWERYEFIRYGFSLVWDLVLILNRIILEQSINNKMVSKI